MSTDPRRILHVIATLNRGGTEVACENLIGALQDRGIENRVVAITRGGGDIGPALEPMTGPPVVLPPGRLARMRAFHTLLIQEKTDAVIFHFFTLEHVLLGLVARVSGVRRITVKQGNPAGEGTALRRKLRWILAASRGLGLGLVSASRYIENTMRGLGPLPRNSQVVHNGCHVDAIAARAAITRQAAAVGPLNILMVARLDRIKDHATLLKAFATLPSETAGRPLRLQFAGEGDLRGALETQAAELNLTDRVDFLGARSDIPELLGTAALFCLSTTVDEGFGVVLIEALAAGTPVVASDVPACREVLEAGKLGQLVPAADSLALAQALSETLHAVAENRHLPPPRGEIKARYDVSVMAAGDLAALEHTWN